MLIISFPPPLSIHIFLHYIIITLFLFFYLYIYFYICNQFFFFLVFKSYRAPSWAWGVGSWARSLAAWTRTSSSKCGTGGSWWPTAPTCNGGKVESFEASRSGTAARVASVASPTPTTTTTPTAKDIHYWCLDIWQGFLTPDKMNFKFSNQRSVDP